MCREILSALIGAGGTVLGAMLTLVITKFVSMGGIGVYPSKYKMEAFIKSDSPTCDKNEAKEIILKVNFDLLNKSSNVKSMRDIKIAFFKNKNKLFDLIPRNFKYDFNNLNLEPKVVIGQEFKIFVDDKIDKFWEANIIKIIYRKKNKEKKLKLGKVNFEKALDNYDAWCKFE